MQNEKGNHEKHEKHEKEKIEMKKSNNKKQKTMRVIVVNFQEKKLINFDSVSGCPLFLKG